MAYLLYIARKVASDTYQINLPSPYLTLCDLKDLVRYSHFIGKVII